MAEGVAIDEASSGVRLCELVAALSLAADLGLGLPMEHVLRSCLLAVRFGREIDLSPEDLTDTYWVTLMATVGCSADSFELAKIFGDDIELRRGTYDMSVSSLGQLRYFLSRSGSGSGAAKRALLAGTLLATGGRAVEDSVASHCQVTGQLALGVNLSSRVQEALLHTFARWDGKGAPRGLSGSSIALSTQLMNISDVAEVHHRRDGTDAAIRVVRAAAGTYFDPTLVEAWCDTAPEVLGTLRDDSNWDDVISEEPDPRPALTNRELDAALASLGDIADLKSPWFAGHSRGVASLAAAAAERAGCSVEETQRLRRAGWVHDLGRTGIPNTIWDKPGTLSPAEHERVKLHAYYTDRMLSRPARLAELGAIASWGHERLDGTGYHRGAAGPAISRLGRLLAAADVYHALNEARPHRPARVAKDAASVLRRLADDGTLDRDAVEAVVVAAGHETSRRSTAVAGLTPRETEVLVLVARGQTTKQVARALGITPKTAGNHVERIYGKIGANSRSAATLFAMQHGLLETITPLGTSGFPSS